MEEGGGYIYGVGAGKTRWVGCVGRLACKGTKAVCLLFSILTGKGWEAAAKADADGLDGCDAISPYLFRPRL